MLHVSTFPPVSLFPLISPTRIQPLRILLLNFLSKLSTRNLRPYERAAKACVSTNSKQRRVMQPHSRNLCRALCSSDQFSAQFIGNAKSRSLSGPFDEHVAQSLVSQHIVTTTPFSTPPSPIRDTQGTTDALSSSDFASRRILFFAALSDSFQSVNLCDKRPDYLGRVASRQIDADELGLIWQSFSRCFHG